MLRLRYSFYEAQQVISHKFALDKKKWGEIIALRTREGTENVMRYFFREQSKQKNCLALTFTEFVKDLPATYAKIYDFIGSEYRGSEFEEIVKQEVEDHKKFKGELFCTVSLKIKIQTLWTECTFVS